uniref:Protein SHQ1 homolog n=2 Tax=Mesocestoides corti TaxID=53468 RepID=A0A5K3ENL3_MESCO
MLTPLFSLTQTDEELTLKLHIPLADLSNSEFLLEDGVAYFSAPPYYLRLELPGSVVEDDDHIEFNLDAGDMFISMKKKTPGEHFDDLDLLSKLMVNSQSSKSVSKPGIQELDLNITPEGETEYDWFVEPPTAEHDDDDDVTSTEGDLEVGIKHPYGFAGSKNGLCGDKPEICLPIDLPNPDFCPPEKRHKLQLQSVKDHFDPEHYIADFCETEATAGALSNFAPWLAEEGDRPTFTDDHRYRLTVLSTHPLPLLPPLPSPADPTNHVEGTRTFVYLGLADLLLAYTHDYYVREGDDNSESAWIIAKVAATLSWLEFFPNVKILLRSFYERALSYPLIRNWRLCRKVQADVGALFQHKHAKSWILFVLLEIRRLLIDYTGYYIFVDLFLDDYIVWLQKSASTYVLNHLGAAIESLEMKKSDVNLPLQVLEDLSAEILESEKLTKNLGEITLKS